LLNIVTYIDWNSRQLSRNGRLRFTRDDLVYYEYDIAFIAHVHWSFDGHSCFLRDGNGTSRYCSNGASNN